MKYALIYYKYTDNLGDDILSYAAKQFLPRIDYSIDRESMNIFVPEEKELVTCILNGWYLHYFHSFPPSPYIHPLFVGTHFRRDDLLFGDYSYLENKCSMDYLKKNEPIGCRDSITNEVMQRNGIKSYFSGCLTLTLEPFQGIEKNHKIILTDVPEEIENYIRNILPDKNIVTRTHLIPDEKRGTDWELRENWVEDHLKLYQGADLVITTRLHCALPATALGTKVLLISKYDEDWNYRMSDYAKYCTMFSAQEILDKKADNILKSPELIHNESIDNIKKELVQTCKDFLEEAKYKSENNLPNREEYLEYYVDRTFYMRRCISRMYQICKNLNDECSRAGETLVYSKSIIEKLLQENERLNKLISQTKNEN